MGKLTALVVAAVLMMSGAAFAKIGVVNFQKVLSTSDSGKSVYNKLKSKAAEFDNELEKLSKEIKKLQDDFEKQADLLTPEAKDKKSADINRLIREFNGAKKDYSNQIQRIEARYLKDIESEVLNITEKLGKELDYELIVEFQHAGVMYYSDKVDITDIVIERYNKEWNVKK
jgi:outer membrane protein